MPFSSSDLLMNHAFKKPAVEQAKNDDIVLNNINLGPVAPFVIPDNAIAFLMPNATLIEETTAAL